MKDIKVGQKFLSGGSEVEIVCVTRRHDHFPVVVIGCATGDLSVFTTEGKYFYDRDDVRDLRPLPATITEGVEFSGPEYREEFERLVKEGRLFQFKNKTTGDWCSRSDDSDSLTNNDTYRLIPQHTDAVGNVLKVGDRVECDGNRYEITGFDETSPVAYLQGGIRGSLKSCRKLKTVNRPLRADDLDKAPCPQFMKDSVRGFPMWTTAYMWFNDRRFKYDELESCQWRPSADQPWGPCEVEEEVLA